MKALLTWRAAVCAVVGSLALTAAPAPADVVPGDIIDTSNWQKAEGLLPDPILSDVKKGDIILNIGTLNYDPVWEPAFQQASEANAGKYDLDADGNIVDPKTGKRPAYIYGFPFPHPAPNDPRAGEKLAWNRSFALFKGGQTYFPYSVEWVGRGGFERRIRGVSTEYYFDGRPTPVNNPDAAEMKEATNVTSPASVEGFIQLTWRYLDNRPDSVWSYVPAMRRTRQLSSVNRSDPFLGSDFTSDDTFVWFGKNQSMTWKLVGQQDVLVQTAQADPTPFLPGPEGDGGTSWVMSKEFVGAKFGYETPGWTGAPWAMTNVLWVKRPVYLLEAFPKDPYYSYGRQVVYADRENGLFYYKVIYNRAGEYWKVGLNDMSPGWSADGSHRYAATIMQMAIDHKTDHAGVGSGSGTQGNITEYNTGRVHPEMLSVDSLLRFGK